MEAPDTTGAFCCCHEAGDPPYARLRLWPHKSLTPGGFVWFIGLTGALILLPLIAVVGSPVLWGILPFMLGALAAIWWALKASWSSKDMLEELTVWSDRMHLCHCKARGTPLEWSANPHWVTVSLHPSGGPVENYLTLRGGGREVELGAFLSPEERAGLYHELRGLITHLR